MAHGIQTTRKQLSGHLTIERLEGHEVFSGDEIPAPSPKTLSRPFRDVVKPIPSSHRHSTTGEVTIRTRRQILKIVLACMLSSTVLVHAVQVMAADPTDKARISAVMAGDRLTVFARTLHGTLTHKYYDPQQQAWTDWVHLGSGEISSAPAAVMAGDRLTVFARTMHGTLTHKFYDPQRQAWTDWAHLGGGEIQ